MSSTVLWIIAAVIAVIGVIVLINGSVVGTIDLYAPTTHTRVIGWQKTWSTSATRTIKVVVLGTSGRPRVDVDAFVVLK